MPRWSPTNTELDALIADCEKQAGSDKALADSLLFRALFHGTTGLYPRRGAKAEWKREKGEWVRYRRNMSRREWIERFFPVRDIDGKIVLLKLNPAQRMAEAAMLRMERAGVPVRIHFLKARQVGMSTYSEAVGFELTLRGDHIRGLVIAHNQDTSKMLLNIADLARAQMVKRHDGDTPIPWNFKMKSKATYSLEFANPVNGQIVITSANTEGAGIGGTRTFVHLSEGSRYEPGNTVHQGVMPSLPNRPGTYGIEEATAFGDTGKFCDDFWSAWEERHKAFLERKNPWQALFFSWLGHPYYVWTKAYGLGRKLPEAMVENIKQTLTADERKLLQLDILVRWSPDDEWEQRDSWETTTLVMEGGKIVGERKEDTRAPKVAGEYRGARKVWRRKGVGWQKPGYDHIAWRRQRIEDKDMGGDVKKFDQDYPWCPEVAFMASGNPVFDPEWVNKLSEEARQIPVKWQGWIVEDTHPVVDANGAHH